MERIATRGCRSPDELFDMSTHPDFVALKRHCIEAIRAERLRAFEQQNPEVGH